MKLIPLYVLTITRIFALTQEQIDAEIAQKMARLAVINQLSNNNPGKDKRKFQRERQELNAELNELRRSVPDPVPIPPVPAPEVSPIDTTPVTPPATVDNISSPPAEVPSTIYVPDPEGYQNTEKSATKTGSNPVAISLGVLLGVAIVTVMGFAFYKRNTLEATTKKLLLHLKGLPMVANKTTSLSAHVDPSGGYMGTPQVATAMEPVIPEPVGVAVSPKMNNSIYSETNK